MFISNENMICVVLMAVILKDVVLLEVYEKKQIFSLKAPQSCNWDYITFCMSYRYKKLSPDYNMGDQQFPEAFAKR